MKKMIIAVLALAVMLSAAIVPVDRAKTVAENYYRHYAPEALKDATVQKVLTKEYLGQPTWYVFAFDKGWVIVTAEDNVDPILGYSYDSPIDEDIYNMQNPFVKRFSSYDKQIVHDIREKNYERPVKQKEWKDIENKMFKTPSVSKATKGPLLETTWGQNYPFNLLCPTGCPVGCVATSASMILRFHLGPDAGAGSNNYTDTQGTTTGAHSVDFSAQLYDWSLMMATTGGLFDTEEKRNEIARLSYHLGVSVNMNYETDGSGSNGLYMIDAWHNNWGFPDAIRMYLGSIADSSVQNITIKAEIDDNRPLQWMGQGPDGGHAFNLDGYNIDAANGVYLYHFNWGWSGSYDGWFKLNDLSPGTSDFSESQEMHYNLFINGILAKMPPPATCGASANTSGDVTVTWTAPNPVPDMCTLVDYKVYRNNSLIKTMGGTGTLTYVDPARPEGTWNYLVKAVYTDPDGNSLASPTGQVSITPDPAYPVPIGLKASGMSDVSTQFVRSYADLSWAKPFVGVTYFYDGFEGNTLEYPNDDAPNGWTGKTASAYPLTSWATTSGVWQAIGPSYSTAYKIQGQWCMGTIPGVAAYQMVFNNTRVTFSAQPRTKLTFWPFAWASSTLKVVLFSGTSLADSPSGKITEVASYTFDTDYHLTAVKEVDLSSVSGQYYVGFVGDMANGSFFTIDEVLCGYDTYISPGNPAGQPTQYEIYRNNALVTTVAVAGLTQNYQDATYEDGTNEYYVRAVYAGSKYSIASNPNSCWMDMAPAPHWLQGTYNEGTDECSISWYAPSHYPAHWFAWEYETDDWWLLEYVGEANVYSVRTRFTAIDFNMGYPVYLDSISCAFIEYDDADPQYQWQSTQFKYAIGYGWDDDVTYLHTSANLTAIEDGSFIDYALPSTLTITEDWFVEIQFVDLNSCTPSPMMLVHEEGNGYEFNTVWHWDGDGGSYDEGWYAYTYDSPYGSEDLMLYCHGWNDKPTFSKESSVSVSSANLTGNSIPKPVKFTPQKTFSKISHEPKGRILKGKNDSKAFSTYNVYRNGSLRTTTTSTTYTDTTPLVENTYYITAVWTSPAAESDPSNEITLGPPPAISVPATIAESVAPSTVEPGSFNISNTGNGYLYYDIDFAYDGVVAVGGTVHSNDFATFPGTGYTVVGSWAASSGAAKITGVKSPGASGTLTSPTFSTVGRQGVTLAFTQTFVRQNSTGSIAVEYYDGSDWVQIYTASASTSAAQNLSLPVTSASTRIRFIGTGILKTGSGANAVTDSWTIDNIVVTSEDVPYTWMSFTSPLSGTVLNSSSNAIGYSINTAGLTLDESYTGTITITSNDATSPNVIPFTLTVEEGGQVIPLVPNITTSLVSGQVKLDWPDDADADSWDVYMSADPTAATPWGTPTNVAVSEYTYAGAEGKMFFYVIAKNSTKSAVSNKIEIAKPKVSR